MTAAPAAIGLANSTERFGSVAKTLHWATALLILTLIPLGLVAKNWPYDTSDALAIKAMLFSLHKTLGVATFFVAVVRILWAVVQPRPVALGTAHGWQAFMAEVVHYALYAALIIVPLSGWLHHAATDGFAPIWWPFGQNLPFIPTSEPLAAALAQIHFAASFLLAGLIGLHIAGALKHHVIDRDPTLLRMLPGRRDLEISVPTAPAPHSMAPVFSATGIWALVIAGGIGLGLSAPRDTVAAATLEAVPSGWQVQDGTLGITVMQFSQPVAGSFGDWTAAIEFSEAAEDGVHGMVDVTIAIGTLTLGSVSAQATGAEFLNADAFATAQFTGPIVATPTGYAVDGSFTLLETTLPLTLPFNLEIDGDTARASGTATIDRRDFGVGQAYPDESSVGFAVEIAFDLTALRSAD
ncbi:MAG: cytochrome b/b6 domain-containing protein [Pseudomonadota bacterium]